MINDYSNRISRVTKTPEREGYVSLTTVYIVFAATLVFSFIVYFVPLSGIFLHSDVHWLFRLQVVADPVTASQIPLGLQLFGGKPGGVLDGCIAYYQAFGRANCLDVLTFRLLASLAGGSNDYWLASYLILGSGAATILYFVLRKFGLNNWLAILFTFGVVLAPLEPWMTPRISEPKAAVFLLAALGVALTSWRFKYFASAILAAAAALIKEPMVVGWFLVVGISVGWALDHEYRGLAVQQAVRKSLRKIIFPHAILVFVVLFCYIGIMANVEKRADYVFFITEAVPIRDFVIGFWHALQPVWIKGLGWLFLVPLLAFIAAAWHRSRMVEAGCQWYRYPGWWLAITVSVLAIIAHGAIYYGTNRLVGDNRYVVPANYYYALLLSLILIPTLRHTSEKMHLVAGGAVLAAILYVVLYKGGITPEQWAICAVFGVIIVAVYLFLCNLYKFQSIKKAVMVIGALVILVPLVAIRVDAILQSAGSARVDQASWGKFVSELSALPQSSNVRLFFSDPFMIETAWGLQTEMILRGRGDLDFRLEVVDKSAYDHDNGLLRDANESFNLGRRALPSNAHFIDITVDRAGNRLSAPPPPRLFSELLMYAVKSPETFFRERYVHGKVGYLQYAFSRTQVE